MEQEVYGSILALHGGTRPYAVDLNAQYSTAGCETKSPQINIPTICSTWLTLLLFGTSV
ncbi:MAG: hypothetical protein ACM3XO_04810 [Bacteroidota bacterium]